MDKIQFIVACRHMAWVSYQMAAGQPYNYEINPDQRESLEDGIRWRFKNPDTTPEENHNNWMKKKTDQGWKYGPVKDFETKEHPDLVPYQELPEIEKWKDVADLVAHDLAVKLWDDMFR